MKILLNNETLNRELRPFSDIGFVPTMGSIHKGHISLINNSIKLCQTTIVSIFVNPRQFNNQKDFKNYPSNIKKDLSILKKIKAIDFVYIPQFKDIYNSKSKSKIKINKKDKILCAKFRKGHFEGVLDVMHRLTDLIKPKKIFMGKKDFQQLYLVKNFIEKRYKTKVIGCETVRDNSKLALSSRNFLLNNTELNDVGKIAKKLFHLKIKLKNNKNIDKTLLSEKEQIQNDFNIKVEYLELRKENNLKISKTILKSKIFISYYLNNIRLIDNF